MQKTYNPATIEQHWYAIWEEKGYFTARQEGQSFCIMLPPPNVTGNLHMGHAFQDTIMDALIRYQRMQGYHTLWQPGTDHAGIATQMIVERLINQEGKTRHDYGRDKFIQRIWEWKEESGNAITKQLRRMGASLDWSRERFTMDAGLSTAVKEAFVSLYEEGLIYRGKRLVNWDPMLHTAVSDLEVLPTEENGFMWYMRYPLSNGSGHLIVATTRPETMLGDAAVAIHPDDDRYKHLLGELIKLPFSGRLIPLIADEYVDPELGTGCVKITPAHDFNDYEIWTRHKEVAAIQEQIHGGLINIFTADAVIRENAKDELDLIPTAYIGLDRFAARQQIVADLDALNLLEKIVEHKLMVPRGDRSGSIIEPLLTNQWYVKVAPLAKPALEAVKSGKIQFIPDNWKNTYYDWMNNIQDWCISRQIWWGHRIPAWYDELDNIYVGRSEQAVRDQYKLAEDYPLTQDEDVLDTWFSSALWPFSALGWPEKTVELKQHYPSSVLVTGFDIIFFWVARMIMLGIKFMGDVPFKQVYIHGLVRDAKGQKMSKSKGNVLNPIDLIDGISLEDLVSKRVSNMMQPHLVKKIENATRHAYPKGIPSYGTDALRLTFASLASTGRDIRLDSGRIDGYRHFCNKLWNAARFVLLNTENQDCGINGDNLQYSQADKWIVSCLNQVITSTSDAIENYRLDHATQEIYEFIWNEYCDWYLELAKISLQTDNADLQRGTRKTLLTVLETILRLAHPIMPFITEEIWQRVAPLVERQAETIMLQSYPKADTTQIDTQAVATIEWVKQFISAIRHIRGEMNISAGQSLPVLLENITPTDRQYLLQMQVYLQKLGRIKSIHCLTEAQTAPESAIALVNKLRILIPMAGLIDKEAEIARLEKEMARLEKDLPRIEGKLNNPKFINKAPTAVVDREKEKLANIQSSLIDFNKQLLKMQAL